LYFNFTQSFLGKTEGTMAHDIKWKFFYDSSRHDLDELISFAEEELIKEEISENMKSDLPGFLATIDENCKTPTLFFEDKGIVYGLTENLYFHNKLNHNH
jgi:hypothetical protein